jgi:hypothetical protein
MPTATAEPATEKQVGYAQRLIREADISEGHRDDLAASLAGLTKREMSELIDDLQRLPRKRRPEPQIAQGIYLLGDQVYKVQLGKGSGKPYALALTDGRFEYSAGAIFTLAASATRPITLDEAIAYGLRTTRCICCGHDLWQEDSLRAGVGPVCARNHFGATPKQLRQRAEQVRLQLTAG